MKIEENLVNNDEIDLIFSPSHIIIGSNKENKIHSETNLKKYCLIIFIHINVNVWEICVVL